MVKELDAHFFILPTFYKLKLRLFTDSPFGRRLEDVQQDPRGGVPRGAQPVGLVPPAGPRGQLAHIWYDHVTRKSIFQNAAPDFPHPGCLRPSL